MRKLLIIGAGGHGKVVAEVAQDCGYEEIAFLDDNSTDAIGKTDEIENFARQYEDAFVGIGNNELRQNMLNRLKEAGYHIPVLVHPTAYVSKTTEIAEGMIVEPEAIVNTETVIGTGCIISVGSVVDHNVVLEECVHVNAGALVENGRKIEAGEIVPGYSGKIVP